MKVLYIGEKKTHELYLKGKVPSHWLYGAVEMEEEGMDVIWTDEASSILNDIHLISANHPDIVFIPNLNLRNHFLVLLLSSIGILKTPIYAYLHHEPKAKFGFKSKIYRQLLCGCAHLFFLSEKSLEETCRHGLADVAKCSVPGWGSDRSFYEQVAKTDGDYFVSTGKENRDFDILIEAFKNTGAPLKIFTARSHAGINYEYLLEKCKNIPNIAVELTENSADSYPKLLDAMAHSKAIVCPLRQDKLNYSVGLSTIVDAEGLVKPLIITRNPYHSEKRLTAFSVVESENDWENAINSILRGNNKRSYSLEYSIKKCWKNMKPFIL